MGRINKTIDGVFVDIVGNENELSLYDRFLKNGSKIVKDSEKLSEMTAMYKTMIVDNKETFNKLASLEEVIMQMRIRETLSDIKFTQTRDYIYARTPFYRKDKKSKDIRVLVSKIESFPEADGNLDILFNNEEFMKEVIKKLGQAMDNEIMKNWNILINVLPLKS